MAVVGQQCCQTPYELAVLPNGKRYNLDLGALYKFIKIATQYLADKLKLTRRKDEQVAKVRYFCPMLGMPVPPSLLWDREATRGRAASMGGTFTDDSRAYSTS